MRIPDHAKLVNQAALNNSLDDSTAEEWQVHLIFFFLFDKIALGAWTDQSTNGGLIIRSSSQRHIALFLAMVIICIAPCKALAGDRALTVYGGRITEDKWFESLPPGVNFADSYIAAATAAWSMATFHGGALSLEIEGQVVKHFGDQDHLEFNLPLAARWHNFVWDGLVDTSFAFGLGPSWATQEPEVETEVNGSTSRFLVHWFAEFTVGPPDSGWAALFRLHHRSKAFGLVAEEGGSNTLAAGVRMGF